MSNIALVSPASGTATFSITTPSGTSTDRTLTLPDNSGTLLSNASTAGFPAGSVLQVVNAVYSTEALSTSTTYADTGLTASITPTSASSKILVFVNQAGVGKRNGDTRAKLRLLRDGTQVIQFENNAGYTANSDINRIGASSTSYLDSPATTSSVTYKTQYGLQDGSGQAGVQYDGASSTITLMEIAA
jgi:hypothetical protein